MHKHVRTYLVMRGCVIGTHRSNEQLSTKYKTSI